MPARRKTSSASTRHSVGIRKIDNSLNRQSIQPPSRRSCGAACSTPRFFDLERCAIRWSQEDSKRRLKGQANRNFSQSCRSLNEGTGNSGSCFHGMQSGGFSLICQANTAFLTCGPFLPHDITPRSFYIVSVCPPNNNR